MSLFLYEIDDTIVPLFVKDDLIINIPMSEIFVSKARSFHDFFTQGLI